MLPDLDALTQSKQASRHGVGGQGGVFGVLEAEEARCGGHSDGREGKGKGSSQCWLVGVVDVDDRLDLEGRADPEAGRKEMSLRIG